MKQTSTTIQARSRFELGDLCYTPGAQALLIEYRISPFQLLARHVVGDFGNVCAEDAQTNEEALELGGRVMSVYVLTPPKDDNATKASAKVWVITESDRSVTTLLLPEEY
ncbi:MAG: type I restriction endonuclease subunit M [Methyloglobulus sp.]|nr:type I restriction endonuclease subunit M [Methyloglobulus sp.]